ncbi:MAG: glycosyltransferase family 2 protein, partial [Candidatus Marinimicrobia bacterium]|nr:glycosyltransferase family 2 protein [Candidatus Neomarinimicrobiota bacterium]
EELKVCEDYDLWLRITAKYPVLYLDEPLIIKYGGHKNQLSKVPEGIERYRIQTLEKLGQDKKLDLKQKYLVERMLVKKYNIYAKGVLKRGRKGEYEKLMKKIRGLEINMEAMQNC